MTMSIQKIYENLCWYDTRSPECIPDVEIKTLPRQEKCYCDNCFYGRDKLAIEILILNQELEKSKELHSPFKGNN